MKFKHSKDKKMFTVLHPILIMIYADLFYYTKRKYNIDLVVTSTLSNSITDKVLGRTSPAHREGRALDISVKNLSEPIISDIVSFINSKEQYKEHHYLSTGGEKRIAYRHFGKGDHIHMAIHSRYSN